MTRNPIIAMDEIRSLRNGVQHRCEDLGLCKDAIQRCIERAFGIWKSTGDSTHARIEAVRYARRLAGLAHHRATPPCA